MGKNHGPRLPVLSRPAPQQVCNPWTRMWIKANKSTGRSTAAKTCSGRFKASARKAGRGTGS
jgi:hypothetical protein